MIFVQSEQFFGNLTKKEERYMADYKAVLSSSLGNRYDSRYVIVSTETGEILDDAQGYGYRTAQKAYAAYAYKNRDRSKDKIRSEKQKRIRQWMKEHKSFVRAMDEYAFEIAKGSWGPNDKFDAKFVKRMLKDEGLEPDFSAGEFLDKAHLDDFFEGYYNYICGFLMEAGLCWHFSL